MERDNRQPAASLEDAFGSSKRSSQFAKFVIDQNAQSLKRPRRWMNIAGTRAHDAADDVGKYGRRPNGRLAARAHDRASDCA